MRSSTAQLAQFACRVTFFTRANCSLCVDAKQILSRVWDRTPFEYTEVDVMAPKQEKWKRLYEFDTPVVHIDKTLERNSNFMTTAAARKLMHRFTEQQVESAIGEEMLKPPD